MTDKELIKALWCCVNNPRDYECKENCVFYCGGYREKCATRMGRAVIHRLEALLLEYEGIEANLNASIEQYKAMEQYKNELHLENRKLKREIEQLKAGKDTNVPTKWVSANERLPESADHSVLVVVHGLYENTNGHRAILLQNAVEIATYFRDDEKWLIEAYPQWEIPYVTHWMPIPEPPGTEGVE